MPPELPEKFDIFDIPERESQGGPFELRESLFEYSNDQELQEKLNLLVDENLELREGISMSFLKRFVILAITINMNGESDKTVYQKLFIKLLRENIEFDSDDLESCVVTFSAKVFFGNFDLLKSKIDTDKMKTILKTYFRSAPFESVLNFDKLEAYLNSIGEPLDLSVEDILDDSMEFSLQSENLKSFLLSNVNLRPFVFDQVRDSVFENSERHLDEVISKVDFYANFFTPDQVNELTPAISDRLEENPELLFHNYYNLHVLDVDMDSLMNGGISTLIQNREYDSLLNNLSVIKDFYNQELLLVNRDRIPLDNQLLNLVSIIANDPNFSIYSYADDIMTNIPPQIGKTLILNSYKRDLDAKNIAGVLDFLDYLDDPNTTLDIGFDIDLVELSNTLELDKLNVETELYLSERSHQLVDLMLSKALNEEFDTFVSHIHFASSQFDYSRVISESIDTTLAKRLMTNIPLLNKLSSTHVQNMLDVLLRDDINFIFDSFFQDENFEPESIHRSQSKVSFEKLNSEKQMVFLRTFIDNKLWQLVYHADKCLEAPELSDLREIIAEETFVALDSGFAIQAQDALYFYNDNLELVNLILESDLSLGLANYGVTYDIFNHAMSHNIIKSHEALDNGDQEFFSQKRLQVVFFARNADVDGVLSGSNNVNDLYSGDANTLYFELETENDMYAYMNQLSELGVNIDLLLFVGHGSSNGISLGSADERGQLDISDRDELQAVANSASHILQGTNVILWSCKTGQQTEGVNIADVMWSTIAAQGKLTAPMMSVYQPSFRYYNGGYQVTYPQDSIGDGGQQYVLENLMFQQ